MVTNAKTGLPTGFYLVVKSKWVGHRGPRGIVRETDLYELTLSCGHKVTRSESKAHVMAVKCKEQHRVRR